LFQNFCGFFDRELDFAFAGGPSNSFSWFSLFVFYKGDFQNFTASPIWIGERPPV